MKKYPQDELVGRSKALNFASANYNGLLEDISEGYLQPHCKKSEKDAKIAENGIRELRNKIGRKRGEKLAQILRNKYKKRQENER